jgi:hypothetical protein
MRPSLRFLAVAVLGWAGFRAWTLGSLPDLDLFQVGRSEAKTPPIVQTQFPAIEPVEPATPMLPATDEPLAQPAATAQSPPSGRYVQGLVGVPVAMRPGVVAVYQLPPPARPQLPQPRQPARISTQLASFNLAG